MQFQKEISSKLMYCCCTQRNPSNLCFRNKYETQSKNEIGQGPSTKIEIGQGPSTKIEIGQGPSTKIESLHYKEPDKQISVFWLKTSAQDKCELIYYSS
ncbi:hypothetical protein NPIL_567551 [Nephila pilipes]|uniref:Uncharacterized protein n=1 Tax=Nephila pilipes TaxID=299642 RepID=A0A8X6TNH4_NEPPI|nr:hypothetical protein NPIL_567551 [Nephila pilipes]